MATLVTKNRKAGRAVKTQGKLFDAKIYVTLKKSVLDPQGKVILHSLHSLDFKQVDAVRVGKYFEIQIKAKDLPQAKAEIAKMCDELLANTVIEQFRFDVEEAKK